MNFEIATAAGFVAIAAAGFVLGALLGRSMLAEMRAILGGLEARVSAIEHSAFSHGAKSAPATAAAHPAPASAEPAAAAAVAPAAAHAAALAHHAGAVEKLAQAIEKHAQAIDEHGAATVAAAVELSAQPAAQAHPAIPAAHQG